MQTPSNRLKIYLILIIAFSFIGCTPRRAFLFGVEDYVRLPKGTIIKSVPMTFEGETKRYDIVLSKEGAFFSVDAQKYVFPGTH